MVLCQFIAHFHKAVLDNNLAEITVAYESGWNRLTEKFYAKTEWPEAEVIAHLVNDGASLQRVEMPGGPLYGILTHHTRPNLPYPLS